MDANPFHEGELEAQRLAGESERGRSNGRVIADEIPRGALAFIAQQPFFLAATLDPAGRPWAWIVAGEPGFVEARSRRELVVNGERSTLLPDELRAHLAADDSLGLLFIEPATRRRLRVNGRGRLRASGGFAVEVAQSFPNCTKYVQRRALARARAAGPAATLTHGRGAPPDLPQRLARADTFFVASRGPGGALDVSHRGGRAGFVALDGSGVLRIPDFAGNSMFNTFGNLLRDPRAGLVFVDFEGGDVLQLVGRAALEFGERASDADEHVTGRSWSFAPEEWLLGSGQLPFRMLRLV
jgi:predicted pyridoxine 5'-phosphate oxidase superfamily flavin-nucleotide-binding protein